MASTGATAGGAVSGGSVAGASRVDATERNHETKAAFKTTEFWAMLGLIAAILVSAAVIKGGDNGTDQFIARNAWLYVSIIGGAYFISRGLAKAGTYEPDRDYNPAEVTDGRAGEAR